MIVYEMIYFWLQAKAVNSIVRHVAEILGYKTDQELEDLYRSVIDFCLYCLLVDMMWTGLTRVLYPPLFQ